MHQFDNLMKQCNLLTFNQIKWFYLEFIYMIPPLEQHVALTFNAVGWSHTSSVASSMQSPSWSIAMKLSASPAKLATLSALVSVAKIPTKAAAMRGRDQRNISLNFEV